MFKEKLRFIAASQFWIPTEIASRTSKTVVLLRITKTLQQNYYVHNFSVNWWQF
jgi:hypothetical protein